MEGAKVLQFPSNNSNQPSNDTPSNIIDFQTATNRIKSSPEKYNAIMIELKCIHPILHNILDTYMIESRDVIGDHMGVYKSKHNGLIYKALWLKSNRLILEVLNYYKIRPDFLINEDKDVFTTFVELLGNKKLREFLPEEIINQLLTAFAFV